MKEKEAEIGEEKLIEAIKKKTLAQVAERYLKYAGFFFRETAANITQAWHGWQDVEVAAAGRHVKKVQKAHNKIVKLEFPEKVTVECNPLLLLSLSVHIDARSPACLPVCLMQEPLTCLPNCL